MNCYRLFLFFLLFLAGQLSAQYLAESDFAQYTTAKGLSHNYVTGITQDSTGYLWIATSSGLNRFNGNHFVQFHSTSDSFSLASEDLGGMTWLDKNQLAIYTSGLHIINTKTGATRNLFIPYHRQQFRYKFNMIVRAMGDEEGNTYILSRSGFYHYDKNDKLISRFDYYTEKEVSVAHFFFGRELLELDKKRLLIISINGLYVYDKEKRKVKKMAADDCPPMAEFVNLSSHEVCIFRPHKRGSFFILKSLTDSLVYINIAENKKIVSRLPFNPIQNELHYRSRLITINDTTLYITGHVSGFYKMRFYPETGKVQFYSQKYFSNYQCTDLFKDKSKNLWIATNKGLFRHDPGRSEVQIAPIPSVMDELFPNIVIHQVFVTAGKIYAGTRRPGSLLLYDTNNLQFIRDISFESYGKKLGRTVNIYSITEADSSSLLLATDGPPFLVNKAGTKQLPLFPPEWNKKNDWTNELYRDSRGTFWISSDNVYLYNHGQATFSFIPKETQRSSQLHMPEVIREDAAGNIWMAGHGVSRYNMALHRFDLVLDSFPFIKMQDKQVSALVIDKERNTLWFNSYNNGLISYDIDDGNFHHFTTSHGLPDNNIAALAIVRNKLWMAGSSGLACMDLQNWQITGFEKEDGLPDMPVLNRANFFYDSISQQLYVAFSKGIARFHPDHLLRKKSPPYVFIEDLTISDQKTIFLPPQNITTTWKSNQIRITIGTINFSDGNSQRFAYRIVKDGNTPWTEMDRQPSFNISSLPPGKHRIQVKSYSVNKRWPEQVKELSIVVLPPLWLKDWFLLLMAVLVLLLIFLLIRWRTGLAIKKEIEKTQIEKLKADDYKNQFELEQITNYFSSSLAGKKTEEQVLWDVTNNLIGRMNYEDCVIYLWNQDKTKMVQKAAYGPKGKPELISTNVFEVLPGQGIVGQVMQSRQPLLVNDTTMDSRYRVDDEFRLSEVCVPIIHNDELLGVIDSEHSQPNYFSERDIKILTTIATLIGNKLKQIESEQSLEAKQKELAGINEQLAEARLSALQAQMNPHFIFNALNSIKRMILDGDNETGSRYLSKFALMIRMTLNHSKDIFVTLDENIEYLKAYLEMEQLRFEDSFTYNIFTAENIDTAETAIPSLMIQPLVENAIWHGLMQAETDKKIMISFTQFKTKITCTIEDNGIGIRQSEKLKERNGSHHRSLGLENLQKRIKIMNEKYDTDCSLEITDLKETDKNKSGTRVVLSFNVINP